MLLSAVPNGIERDGTFTIERTSSLPNELVLVYHVQGICQYTGAKQCLKILQERGLPMPFVQNR